MVLRKEVQYYLSDFLERINEGPENPKQHHFETVPKKKKGSSTFHLVAVRVDITTRLHHRSVQFISSLI